MIFLVFFAVFVFLSTPSARRATPHKHRTRQAVYISIHALREEGDGECRRNGAYQLRISIHALREEGDAVRASRGCCTHHFYPRPPRGGRRLGRQGGLTMMYISIHALREEGDTLRGWGAGAASAFLSTPSARRATLSTV